jgi:hypothetical protein
MLETTCSAIDVAQTRRRSGFDEDHLEARLLDRWEISAGSGWSLVRSGRRS